VHIRCQGNLIPFPFICIVALYIFSLFQVVQKFCFARGVNGLLREFEFIFEKALAPSLYFTLQYRFYTEFERWPNFSAALDGKLWNTLATVRAALAVLTSVLQLNQHDAYRSPRQRILWKWISAKSREPVLHIEFVFTDKKNCEIY
jgi:hypothetical protein